MARGSPPQLAGYRDLARMGAGSTGVVHRATRESDGAVVALKIASTDGEWLGREGALLARLARRWGPELLDAGVTPDGARFIASRWVDGQALSTAIAATKDRARLAAIVAH